MLFSLVRDDCSMIQKWWYVVDAKGFIYFRKQNLNLAKETLRFCTQSGYKFFLVSSESFLELGGTIDG
jgi:hypothetical protein